MSNAVLNVAQMATQTSLNLLIDSIATSEKQTRTDLKEFSRTVLPYVMETHDIEVVNRLILVLTVNNAKRFVEYANNFLPWVSEKDSDGSHVRFGKMQASHIVVKSQKKQTEFLLDEKNNFWTWSQAESTPKAKDWAALLKSQVAKSQKGNDATPPITNGEILAAVFSGGFSIDELLVAVGAAEKLEGVPVMKDVTPLEVVAA